jgi:hypothetical protein
MAKGIVRFTCGIIDCSFIGPLNGWFRSHVNIGLPYSHAATSIHKMQICIARF